MLFTVAMYVFRSGQQEGDLNKFIAVTCVFQISSANVLFI